MGDPDLDAIVDDMRNNPEELDAFWHQRNVLRLSPWITEMDMFNLMCARAACPDTEWTLVDDINGFLDKMVDVGHFMRLYTHFQEVMDRMVAPLTFAECVNRWRAMH